MNGQSASFEDTINALTRAIPSSAVWTIADEVLIEALCRNERVVYGRIGARVAWLMMRADAVGLALPAGILLGLTDLARSMWLAWRVNRVPSSLPESARNGVAVFIGFGARAEAHLYQEFCSQASGLVIRIDQTRLAVSTGPVRPGLTVVWSSMMSAIGEAAAAWRSLPASLRARRSDVAATISRRIAPYIFARAWWKEVAQFAKVQDARFMAADVMAFAAVREGISSSFQQHGLLSRGLVFPSFENVYPLTRFEARYLQQRIPGVIVHPPRHVARAVSPVRQRRVLIASTNLPADEMRQIGDLVQKLAACGVTIHVRLFPGESADRFWRGADLGASFTIEDGDPSLEAALERLQPLFVVSWASTVLVEALHDGRIPITVAASDDRYIERTAYPLFRCCLRWPQNRADVMAALAGPTDADRILERLRELGDVA